MDLLQKTISLIHHPRFGGLPAHYPSLAAWAPPGTGWKAPLSALKQPGRKLGVYAHIPFCASRCAFCFLEVIPAKPGSSALDAYARALAREAFTTAAAAGSPRADNIYIGGGTPNLLGEAALVKLAEALAGAFRLKSGAQFSMEANPDFFELKKLRALRAAGVNHLIVGVQSFDPALMRRYTRSQHCGEVKGAFALMRRAGFENINADLLCGLPGQSRAVFMKDLKLMAAIKPTHIHLNRYKASGPYSGKAGAEDLRREGLEYLETAGYKIHDEDSATLYEELMNAQGDPDFQLDACVAGLGAGALSHAWGRGRWQNLADPASYAAAALAGRGAALRCVELSLEDELAHWALNRLLRPLPVTRAQAASRFGKGLLPIFENKMRALLAAGAIRENEPGVFSALPSRWFAVTSGLYGAKYLAAIVARFKLKDGAA